MANYRYHGKPRRSAMNERLNLATRTVDLMTKTETSCIALYIYSEPFVNDTRQQCHSHECISKASLLSRLSPLPLESIPSACTVLGLARAAGAGEALMRCHVYSFGLFDTQELIKSRNYRRRYTRRTFSAASSKGPED